MATAALFLFGQRFGVWLLLGNETYVSPLLAQITLSRPAGLQRLAVELRDSLPAALQRSVISLPAEFQRSVNDHV